MAVYLSRISDDVALHRDMLVLLVFQAHRDLLDLQYVGNPTLIILTVIVAFPVLLRA